MTNLEKLCETTAYGIIWKNIKDINEIAEMWLHVSECADFCPVARICKDEDKKECKERILEWFNDEGTWWHI